MSKALASLMGLGVTTATAVDMLVNDGDELPILGGIRILHTPGHTPGSISLWIPKERVVIVGDVLANRFKLGLPSRAFTVDIAQEINSIRRVANLDVDIICFGHGAPLMHDARSSVARLVTRLEGKYRGAG